MIPIDSGRQNWRGIRLLGSWGQKKRTKLSKKLIKKNEKFFKRIPPKIKPSILKIHTVFNSLLGTCWPMWGSSWPILGPSGGHLGPSWGNLEASWRSLCLLVLNGLVGLREAWRVPLIYIDVRWFPLTFINFNTKWLFGRIVTGLNKHLIHACMISYPALISNSPHF